MELRANILVTWGYIHGIFAKPELSAFLADRHSA